MYRFKNKGSYAALYSSLMLGCAAAISGNVAMAEFDLSQMSSSRIIVKFKEVTSREGGVRSNVLFTAGANSGTILSPLRSMANGALVVGLGENKASDDVDDILHELSISSAVEYAEVDLLYAEFVRYSLWGFMGYSIGRFLFLFLFP